MNDYCVLWCPSAPEQVEPPPPVPTEHFTFTSVVGLVEAEPIDPHLSKLCFKRKSAYGILHPSAS